MGVGTANVGEFLIEQIVEFHFGWLLGIPSWREIGANLTITEVRVKEGIKIRSVITEII